MNLPIPDVWVLFLPFNYFGWAVLAWQLECSPGSTEASVVQCPWTVRVSGWLFPELSSGGTLHCTQALHPLIPPAATWESLHTLCSPSRHCPLNMWKASLKLSIPCSDKSKFNRWSCGPEPGIILHLSIPINVTNGTLQGHCLSWLLWCLQSWLSAPLLS